MRLGALAGLAAGALALSGGAVANAAATTAHQTPRPLLSPLPAAQPGSSPPAAAAPRNVSNYWQNDSDEGDMWYNPTPAQFFSSITNGTPLSPATACNNGYCEHTLPNTKCMQYDSVTNTIDAGTCSGIASQLWSVVSDGGGYYLWINDDANSYFRKKGYCKSGTSYYAPELTAEPSSDLMDMRCPEGSGEQAAANQKWLPS